MNLRSSVLFLFPLFSPHLVTNAWISNAFHCVFFVFRFLLLMTNRIFCFFHAMYRNFSSLSSHDFRTRFFLISFFPSSSSLSSSPSSHRLTFFSHFVPSLCLCVTYSSRLGAHSCLVCLCACPSSAYAIVIELRVNVQSNDHTQLRLISRITKAT